MSKITTFWFWCPQCEEAFDRASVDAEDGYDEAFCLECGDELYGYETLEELRGDVVNRIGYLPDDVPTVDATGTDLDRIPRRELRLEETMVLKLC